MPFIRVTARYHKERLGPAAAVRKPEQRMATRPQQDAAATGAALQPPRDAPSEPARSTPKGEGVAVAERFLMSGFVWFRIWMALGIVVVVADPFDQYGSRTLAIALVGFWSLESAWIVRRIWRRGAYDEPRVMAFDVGFATVLILVGALTHAPLPPAGSFTGGIANAAVLGAGAVSRRFGVTVTISLLLTAAVDASYSLGAADPAGTAFAVLLDSAFTTIALGVGALFLSLEVLRSGRELDAAREIAVAREAELVRERERTRAARELHDHVLQTLETVARGSKVEDEILRAQAGHEAAWLRDLIASSFERARSPKPKERSSEPRQGSPRAERSLLRGYLLFRGATLIWPVVVIPLTLNRLRSPSFGLFLSLACLVESALVARASLRRRSYRSPGIAILDLGFGSVALLASVWLQRTAAAYEPMALFVMGCMLGAGMAFRRRATVLTTGVIIGIAYLATLALRLPRVDLFNPLANDAIWFVGYGLGGWLLARVLRGGGRKTDLATAEAISSAKEIALERERERTESLLAEEVLPTLESLAVGKGVRDEGARSEAERASIWLQAYVQGRESRPGVSNLLSALRETTLVQATLGLTVDLNLAGMWAEESEESVSPQMIEALSGAVHEALENVRKHAGVSHAVVRAVPDAGGVLVTVVDTGRGFDQTTTPLGLGVPHSIQARLADVGGRARIDSAPGSGTRVQLWIPRDGN